MTRADRHPEHADDDGDRHGWCHPRFRERHHAELFGY